MALVMDFSMFIYYFSLQSNHLFKKVTPLS